MENQNLSPSFEENTFSKENKFHSRSIQKLFETTKSYKSHQNLTKQKSGAQSKELNELEILLSSLFSVNADLKETIEDRHIDDSEINLYFSKLRKDFYFLLRNLELGKKQLNMKKLKNLEEKDLINKLKNIKKGIKSIEKEKELRFLENMINSLKSLQNMVYDRESLLNKTEELMTLIKNVGDESLLKCSDLKNKISNKLFETKKDPNSKSSIRDLSELQIINNINVLKEIDFNSNNMAMRTSLGPGAISKYKKIVDSYKNMNSSKPPIKRNENKKNGSKKKLNDKKNKTNLKIFDIESGSFQKSKRNSLNQSNNFSDQFSESFNSEKGFKQMPSFKHKSEEEIKNEEIEKLNRMLEMKEMLLKEKNKELESYKLRWADLLTHNISLEKETKRLAEELEELKQKDEDRTEIIEDLRSECYKLEQNIKNLSLKDKRMTKSCIQSSKKIEYPFNKEYLKVNSELVIEEEKMNESYEDEKSYQNNSCKSLFQFQTHSEKDVFSANYEKPIGHDNLLNPLNLLSKASLDNYQNNLNGEFRKSNFSQKKLENYIKMNQTKLLFTVKQNLKKPEDIILNEDLLDKYGSFNYSSDEENNIHSENESNNEIKTETDIFESSVSQKNSDKKRITKKIVKQNLNMILKGIKENNFIQEQILLSSIVSKENKEKRNSIRKSINEDIESNTALLNQTMKRCSINLKPNTQQKYSPKNVEIYSFADNFKFEETLHDEKYLTFKELLNISQNNLNQIENKMKKEEINFKAEIKFDDLQTLNKLKETNQNLQKTIQNLEDELMVCREEIEFFQNNWPTEIEVNNQKETEGEINQMIQNKENEIENLKNEISVLENLNLNLQSNIKKNQILIEEKDLEINSLNQKNSDFIVIQTEKQKELEQMNEELKFKNIIIEESNRKIEFQSSLILNFQQEMLQNKMMYQLNEVFENEGFEYVNLNQKQILKKLQLENEDLSLQNIDLIENNKKLDEQIEELNNQNISLIQENEELNSLVTESQNEKNLQSEENANIKKEYEIIKSEMESLVNENNNLGEKSVELTNKVSEYEQKISKLNEQNNELLPKLSILTEENNKLSDKILLIEKEKMQSQTLFEEMKKKTDLINLEKENLKPDFEKIQTENEKLKTGLQQNLEKYEELQTKNKECVKNHQIEIEQMSKNFEKQMNESTLNFEEKIQNLKNEINLFEKKIIDSEKEKEEIKVEFLNKKCEIEDKLLDEKNCKQKFLERVNNLASRRFDLLKIKFDAIEQKTHKIKVVSAQLETIKTEILKYINKIKKMNIQLEELKQENRVLEFKNINYEKNQKLTKENSEEEMLASMTHLSNSRLSISKGSHKSSSLNQSKQFEQKNKILLVKIENLEDQLKQVKDNFNELIFEKNEWEVEKKQMKKKLQKVEKQKQEIEYFKLVKNASFIDIKKENMELKRKLEKTLQMMKKSSNENNFKHSYLAEQSLLYSNNQSVFMRTSNMPKQNLDASLMKLDMTILTNNNSNDSFLNKSGQSEIMKSIMQMDKNTLFNKNNISKFADENKESCLFSSNISNIRKSIFDALPKKFDQSAIEDFLKELNQYRLFHENLSLKVQRKYNIDFYGEKLREFIIKKFDKSLEIQNIFSKNTNVINEQKGSNSEIIGETGASVSDKDEIMNTNELNLNVEDPIQKQKVQELLILVDKYGKSNDKLEINLENLNKTILFKDQMIEIKEKEKNLLLEDIQNLKEQNKTTVEGKLFLCEKNLKTFIKNTFIKFLKNFTTENDKNNEDDYGMTFEMLANSLELTSGEKTQVVNLLNKL